MLFINREGQEGQGLVEYMLVLMLIALVVIIILAIFGDEVQQLWKNVVDPLSKVFGG